MHNHPLTSKLYALILLLGVTFAAVNAQPVPRETVVRNGQTFYIYQVHQGEGLQAISRTFNVPVEEILRHNPSANTGLQLGQRLYIPARAGDANRPQSVLMHTVVRGETLFSIAQRHNTTVAEITRLNAGVEAGISEGQTLLIPQAQVQVVNEVRNEGVRYHVILPQETISSVARAFSLHPNDLIAANEGLTPETFSIGRIIRIPPPTPEVILPGHTRHVVQPGETLFSISRLHNVEMEDITGANPAIASEGLRSDMVLQIPTGTLFASPAQLFLPNQQGVIRVGLLLPFNDETGDGHLRMQEYYEGFMLAVLRLREAGANIELLSFDIGRRDDTRRLEGILETIEWQSLDLIIGGTDDIHIRMLSDFARANNIKHAIPFRQNVTEVQSNPQIFQVTAPPNIIDNRAVNEFLRLHRESNIIFVTGGQNNQMSFVNQLQAELRRNNISFEALASNVLHADLFEKLSANRVNVVVPTSDEIELLRVVLNELDDIYDTNTGLTTRLFGYSRWQTYSGLIRRFHRFGTHIFSDFYVNPNAAGTREFMDNFRRWYGRAPMESFPSWAIRGYDTGLFFLTALHRFGTDFEQHLHQLNVPTLQHPFHFERTNNWGGYINTGILIVHFDTDGTIHRIDRSRP